MPKTPPQTTLDALKTQVDGLRTDVNGLKDLLNVHENWNSEIKTMFGKRVKIESVTGHFYTGELLWSDRYCLCVYDESKRKRLTLNKGGVISIELA